MGHQLVQQASTTYNRIPDTVVQLKFNYLVQLQLQVQLKFNYLQQHPRYRNTPVPDSSQVVLTADKGVAMVVMDKGQYVEKCMALLNDTKVYKPCKDTTKKLHRDIQESLRKLNREHGSSRLYDWSKMYYNRLLPTGNSSPAPRFYGLPKIHKANCPMHPIVPACGMATYQLAKFLTKILQRYMGITPSFVKDSKSFSDHLKLVKISGEEELVSFTSVPYLPASQFPQP